MSALKLNTLKQKLWAIVAASFIARLFMFFVLPTTPSPLAPDEGTYAALTKWVAENNPPDDFPTYGGGLYLSARTIIIPARFLYASGVGELNSVRLISTLYALFSLVLIIYLINWVTSYNLRNVKIVQFNENLIAFCFSVYALLPSHFLWSTLGLKESPNEFWLIAIYSLVLTIYSKAHNHKILLLSILAICILFVFNTRPQVGWLTVISLLIFATTKLKTLITYLFIPAVLLGMFGGFLTTTGTAYKVTEVYMAKEVIQNLVTQRPSEQTEQTELENRVSVKCSFDMEVIQISGRKYKCFKSRSEYVREDVKDPLTAATNQIEVIPEKQTLNQFDATSKIETVSCPIDSGNQISNLGCLIWRLPYMSLTFLFRPLPLVDTTSLVSLFASFENIVWIIGFAYIILRLSRNRNLSRLEALRAPIIFLVLYVAGAGSYEGNMGTAFRHKSLILWTVLLLIFALAWKESEDTSTKPRNNSQESAV